MKRLEPFVVTVFFSIYMLLGIAALEGGGSNPLKGVELVASFQETSTKSKLPAEQRNVMDAKAIRDYCKANCSKDKDGNPQFRPNIDPSDKQILDDPIWSEVLETERDADVQWLIVSDGKRRWYSGPMPKGVDATLAKIKELLPEKKK